jgi:hypothetical protein
MIYTCTRCGAAKRHNAFPGKGSRELLCRTCRAASKPRPVEKICTRCGVSKPRDAFGNRTGRSTGTSRCKACLSEVQKAKGTSPSRRDWHLQRRYSISLVDYERLLTAQGGACAICDGPPAMAGGPYYQVDHDHTTGAVRGLLCGKCNMALGYAQDDVARLRRMIAYLEDHVNSVTRAVPAAAVHTPVTRPV